MTYKEFSAELMASISFHLVNRPPGSLPLDKPELASPLLWLTRAHDDLIKLNVQSGSIRTEFDRLSALLNGRDVGHDRFSRCVYRGLEVAAEMTDDPDKAAEYLEVQRTLHPNGLATNQLSYPEQAGNAIRVAERVTPEIRAVLSTVVVDGVSLEYALDRWLEAGREMGELHERRAAIGSAEDPDRVTAADLARARNTWIRAIRAFEAALDLTDFTEAEKSAILAGLRDAAARVARNRKKPADEPVEA